MDSFVKSVILHNEVFAFAFVTNGPNAPDTLNPT